jgi:hypothetical protein
MSHLTPEQLVDAAEDEGQRDPRVVTHLDGCAACRARVLDLGEMMRTASADREMPEPSPLFWDHLSSRVHDAIARERGPAERSWTGGRLVWTLSAAVAAVAIVIAVSIASRTTPDADLRVATTVTTSATNAGEPVADLPVDDSWELIADLTPAMDWDAADEAGIVRPGTSDRALLQLSDAERDELERLLRQELASRPGPAQSIPMTFRSLLVIAIVGSAPVAHAQPAQAARCAAATGGAGRTRAARDPADDRRTC